MGKTTSFDRLDGAKATGYLAETRDPKAPGIVVIQEWWGVSGQITGICDKLAAAGYHALAPDLYEGTVVPYHDSKAAERTMNALDFRSSTDQVVRGAALTLKRNGGKVGLTGYCLGGIVAALGAIRIADFDASVCFYGLPSPELANPRDLKVPFQGHFARKDEWCTPEAVDAFEKGLTGVKLPHEIHRYDAQHGFMNEERPHFDPAAAKLAWERSLAFWRMYLG
ncbi:MAG: dienelactone hydrolase family protein [Alphaproteobacteria bacterium]|nr:dienelactone hydrolase family protein [Alphaproteobacteria bacterium]